MHTFAPVGIRTFAPEHCKYLLTGQAQTQITLKYQTVVIDGENMGNITQYLKFL